MQQDIRRCLICTRATISEKLLHGKITVEHFLSKEFDLCRQPDIMRYLPRILLRAGNTRKYLKYFSLEQYLMKFTACH